MKTFLIAVAILMGAWQQESVDVYQFRFEGLSGDTIDMSAYAGKKVIVELVRTSAPNTERLTALKTLYAANQNVLSVILVPVNDFEPAGTSTDLSALLIDSLQLPFSISSVSVGKKSAAENQHVLLKWLTNKTQNSHFDDDITDEPRMFVVSESGELFADLKGDVDLTGVFMQKILERPDITNEPVVNP